MEKEEEDRVWGQGKKAERERGERLCQRQPRGTCDSVL